MSDHDVDGDETRLDLHRAVMLRLYRGASHSLNNAFTAALGEASFLADEYEHDREVQEACEQIIEQIDRSAKILREVGACDERSATSPCDLATLLRKMGPLLEATSGSQHEVVIEIPESMPMISCSFADVQLALLATIHALLPPGSEATRLEIDARSREAAGSVVLAIELAPRQGTCVVDPARIGEVQTLVEAFGARLRVVFDARPLRVELDMPCRPGGQ